MTDQPSTTATCAAGCGQPIDLTHDHIAIVRNVERETPGQIHVHDATVLERRHNDCQPPQSKNDDPNGCPDTVLGPCEWVCARCGRGHDCPDVVARAQVAAVLGWCDLADEQGGGHSGKLHASTVRAALDAAAAGYV